MNLKQTMSCELKQLDKDLCQIKYLGIVADKLNTVTRIYCGRAKPTLDQSHIASVLENPTRDCCKVETYKTETITTKLTVKQTKKEDPFPEIKCLLRSRKTKFQFLSNFTVSVNRYLSIQLKNSSVDASRRTLNNI